MKNCFLLVMFWCFTGICSATPPTSNTPLETIPGLATLSDIEYTGYLPLSATKKKNSGKLFYWYVENEQHQAKAPLVLWLNGGPGASSMYGFFMEHGPYMLDSNGTITKRRYSWTQQANYLVIDQPAGVGLSYGEPNSYADEAEAMDQLYYAVRSFFHRYPQLSHSPFYLAGESYAGKYLPQLALRILEGNKTANTGINLKGLLVGDAWVNPKIQQYANADFAYYHGLIDKQERTQVLALYHACAQEIDKAIPSTRRANQVCMKIQEFIQQKSGRLNLANIASGTEPDDQAMIHYLNKPQVRQALHIDKRIKQFHTFSDEVADHLEQGAQDSVAPLYPQILAAGIRVLIYNGLDDGKDSNYMSTNLWLEHLSWPFKTEFAKAPRCVWHVEQQVAGYAKTARGLTQVAIRNAGHLAPIDQPARVLDLFNHFIKNQPLC